MECVRRWECCSKVRWFAATFASFAALVLCVLAGTAPRAEPESERPLRVAVYDAMPYGGQRSDGLFVGASVDLWRRVAEDRHWRYQLTLVSQMENLLSGLQGGAYDVGVGAITITPERLARVEFSYPAHRSGVTAVFAKQTGAAAALHEYAAALGQLGPLIVTMVIFLTVTGMLMWWLERSYLRTSGNSDSQSVTSWHEGIYWAVVTMTTVGYGDKAPKTPLGRGLAMVWMVGSLVMVSLLTTTLVADITAGRVQSVVPLRASDLVGKRLAAVSGSSGAEYLDAQRLAYRKFGNLPDALDALATGKTDAVINNIGDLQYLVSTRFSDRIAPPRGLLAPAYVAFALPLNSALRKPLDRALALVTAGPEWQSVEETYFGR
jgi:ABC-type amino acid transport substrate-binding protein